MSTPTEVGAPRKVRSFAVCLVAGIAAGLLLVLIYTDVTDRHKPAPPQAPANPAVVSGLPNSDKVAQGFPVPYAGAQVTYTYPTLKAARDVTLTAVRPVSGTRAGGNGIDLHRAFIVPTRSGSFVVRPGWWSRNARPLAGYRLRAGEQVKLLLQLTAREAPVSYWSSLNVFYKEGSSENHVNLAFGLALCTTRSCVSPEAPQPPSQ